MTAHFHKFEVSRVLPTLKPVETVYAHQALETVLNGKVESCSMPGHSVVQPYGFHAVIETLHRAYDEHRPVILSPDDIWLMVSQGFAACVNQDPERYRACFVSHDDKKEIRIRRDDFVMGVFDNDWRGCFPEFSARIREHIGDENHRLIASDFSTTGDLERAASEVVLMDTVQSYFEYVVETRCGIPSITLLGTSEDWQKVVSKTSALARFGGLDWWLNKAVPVVEQFARAASGHVDVAFWQGIYKGEVGSGTLTADGHILLLLPYTKDSSGNTQQNPFLTGKSRWGLESSELPQALSCVPFVWEYHGKRFDYQFLAGHVGIRHEQVSGSLRPLVGWAVRPNPATSNTENLTTAIE